jgi:hypothetical protein
MYGVIWEFKYVRDNLINNFVDTFFQNLTDVLNFLYLFP